MGFSVVPLTNTGDSWSAANHVTYIKDNFAAVWVGTQAGDIDYYTSATTKARLQAVASKFIRFNAAADAIEAADIPGGMTTRQGGSATDWNTSGTTNYPVTNSMVQSGAYQETLGTVPGKSGQIITFPVAFSGKPAVMTSIEHVSGARYGIASSVVDVSATQFTIYAGTEVSSGWDDVVIVHWEAKGTRV